MHQRRRLGQPLLHGLHLPAVELVVRGGLDGEGGLVGSGLGQRQAGRLRDAPNGNVIGGVPGNTQVQVLNGRQTTDDNIVWVHIRITNTGQTGWFSESLIKYTATPAP